MPDNPLFGFLSRGALAALPAIQGYVNLGGMSPSAILSAVRSAGFKIRTQTALDLIGVLTNNIPPARALRVTPVNVPIAPGSHGIAPGNQRRNYNYKVLLRGFNKSTGETQNEYVTVASSFNLSIEQILAMAEGFVGFSEHVSEFNLQESKVEEALAKPGIIE